MQSFRTILLVEDHTDTADAFAILLGAQGHTVHVARTVADAQRRIMQQAYDVVFCDIKLPDGSGLDLAPLLKLKCPGAKLVAMTGDSGFEKTREAGFDRHLVKPIEADQLYGCMA
jgi:CheY-like chemotaxis protein